MTHKARDERLSYSRDALSYVAPLRTSPALVLSLPRRLCVTLSARGLHGSIIYSSRLQKAYARALASVQKGVDIIRGYNDANHFVPITITSKHSSIENEDGPEHRPAATLVDTTHLDFRQQVVSVRQQQLQILCR